MSVLPRPRVGEPVDLRELAAGVGGRLTGPDARVTGVTLATDRVHPGDLFVALAGRNVHGARYAGAAHAAGAVAVLTDREGAALVAADPDLADVLPVAVVDDPRMAAGPVAAAVYGDPSADLRVIGVTGTSGKTTTTFLVRAGLAAAGRTGGLIGTVATYVGDDEVKTGFTTPEAPDLQALLAVMRERGVTDVAAEVSSMGLVLGRVAGTRFAAAGFTNLSQDHLDFHGDLDSYFEAKATLFTGATGTTLTGPSFVVVDDDAGRRLAARLGSAATTLSTTGGPADWSAEQVRVGDDGTARFVLRTPHGSAHDAASAIPGRFNVANVLMAVALLDAVGVDVALAVRSVSVATVPGRMEKVSHDGEPLAVVDYSHKPDAVAGALAALRPLTPGRLVIVLGCGGDRDRLKRPLMGEVAARGADLLVVTDDNPRSEDPAAIRAAMLSGALAVPAGVRGEVVEVGSRAEAIRTGLAGLGPGDTVLVAGKGHETGQEVAGVVLPFDDRRALRAALDAREGGAP
ncbi:UDP-N-acetylmuramoyl-L-alanyl-D-glutamate--2,6-diaminopimelate ligase [Jatrophihabitans sp. YIM 134969]